MWLGPWWWWCWPQARSQFPFSIWASASPLGLSLDSEESGECQWESGCNKVFFPERKSGKSASMCVCVRTQEIAWCPTMFVVFVLTVVCCLSSCEAQWRQIGGLQQNPAYCPFLCPYNTFLSQSLDYFILLWIYHVDIWKWLISIDCAVQFYAGLEHSLPLIQSSLC